MVTQPDGLYGLGECCVPSLCISLMRSAALQSMLVHRLPCLQLVGCEQVVIFELKTCAPEVQAAAAVEGPSPEEG